MNPPNLALLAGGLLLSTAMLALVLAAVWWFDRYDREPVRLVLGVFLWGATGAPLLAAAVGAAVAGAGLARWPTGSGLLWLGLGGPAVEEALKGLAVVMVIISSKEFDNSTDGVVYGTAVGLGFAVTENALYGLGGGAGGAAGLASLLLLRTVFSAGVHALASATLGGFLGAAQLVPQRARRVGLALAGLAVAIGLHAGWNLALVESAAGSLQVRGWPLALPLLYLLYGLILAAFLHGEHRILRRQLAREVELGVLPPWVAEVLPFYRRRVRSSWWPVRSERTVLARLITRLAFRTHALSRLPEKEARIAGLEVVQLRRRIRGMLTPPVRGEDDDG